MAEISLDVTIRRSTTRSTSWWPLLEDLTGPGSPPSAGADPPMAVARTMRLSPQPGLSGEAVDQERAQGSLSSSVMVATTPGLSE